MNPALPLSPALWAQLRPPPPVPALQVTAAMIEDAALDAAYRWHGGLEALGDELVSARTRAAAYERMPGAWRDAFPAPVDASGGCRTLRLPAQFPHIHDAPADLTQALAWNVGEVAWLLWLERPEVRALLGAATGEVRAASSFVRTLLAAGEDAEALESLEDAVRRYPDVASLAASLGFAHLTLREPGRPSAEAASRAFTQALDAVPSDLRVEAAGYLTGYAALADALGGYPDRAVARLHGLRAQGDGSPELRFQALRWQTLLPASVQAVVEELEALVLHDPVYFLRALIDPILGQAEGGGPSEVVAHFLARQRPALDETLARVARAQQAAGQHARIGLRLAASAYAEDLDRTALMSMAEVVAVRWRLHHLEAIQRLAAERSRDGQSTVWDDTERRLASINDRLSALPKTLSFRIPRERGVFGPTVAHGPDSDWHIIEQAVHAGRFADGLRYAEALAAVLAQGYGVALSEYAALVGDGLDGLAVYGELVRQHADPWTSTFCRELRAKARETLEISDLLRTLAIARDTQRVAPQFQAAWGLVQQAASLWDRGRSLIGDATLLSTTEGLTLVSGHWAAIEFYVADPDGYPIAGLPVYIEFPDDAGLVPRWPYAALAPGYAVSLATGKALLAVTVNDRASAVLAGDTVVTVLAGLEPAHCVVPVPIRIQGTRLGAPSGGSGVELSVNGRW